MITTDEPNKFFEKEFFLLTEFIEPVDPRMTEMPTWPVLDITDIQLFCITLSHLRRCGVEPRPVLMYLKWLLNTTQEKEGRVGEDYQHFRKLQRSSIAV